MEIILGDIKMIITSSTPKIDTINCVFLNGFKRGGGSREIKNFYCYHDKELGLVFKAGMDWAPTEMKEFMEFLKNEYQELREKGGIISTLDFLSHLISKRRESKINSILFD